MNFQGIKFAYFILGVATIVWIAPLFLIFKSYNLLNDISTEILIVFSIPVLYLMGMLVRVAAWNILRSRKKAIQKHIYSSTLPKEVKIQQVPLLVKAAIENTNIYNRLEEHLSATIIARGFIINLSLSLISFGIHFIILEDYWALAASSVTLSFLLITTYKTWIYFQEKYYLNQCYAYLHFLGHNILRYPLEDHTTAHNNT